MKAVTKYQPGDRIVGTDFDHRNDPGVIVKVAAKSALVRFDGSPKDERVNLDDLEPDTPDRVAAREFKDVLNLWRSAKPRTKFVSVSHRGGWFEGFDETGTEIIGRLTTPAEMLETAGELEAIAKWFAARPAKPGQP